MHKDAREFLERAAECARLAEGVEHPQLRLYLTEHGPHDGAMRCEAPGNSGRSEMVWA
jgi:hypothetical protein